jgi:Ca2+-binding EF-hand superfamily protein
MDDNNSGTLD